MLPRYSILCGLLLALCACQADHPTASAAVEVAPRPVAAPAAGPMPPSPPTARPASTPKQTLFPDTLRPRLLEVTRWSDRELDSIQAQLDSIAVGGSAEAQHGRFRTINFYDEKGMRFFYREASQPTGWAELNLSYWLSEFNSLPFIDAREVALTPTGPQALLLAASGGNYGSGGGTQVNYTFIIDLAGPPTLVWQSTDEYVEEAKPTGVDSQGETTGGNYASTSRTVTIRHGLVHVGRVKQEGKFEFTDNTITPITPGYYRYEAGRFHRVTP